MLESLQTCRPETLLKRDSNTGVMKCVTFLRTPIFIEHLWWMLLILIGTVKLFEVI